MILPALLQDLNPWWRDGKARCALGYPVRRKLQSEILDRILHVDDRRARLLLGPRQVGKTVLLLQLADDLLEGGWPAANLTYFDFSDDRLTGQISARDVVAVKALGIDPDRPRVFLFDEIRSSASWDLWLKQAVDEGIGRIIATDSAASLLRDGARESGQGRWEEVYIEGLSFWEFVRLHSAPSEQVEETLRRQPSVMERYLAIGGFPEHSLSDDFPEVRRRLRSDIAERAIVRDLSGLGLDVERVRGFFVYLLQDSGADFNAEARARDLGADPRTVRDWVRHLTDTLLISTLDRFARNPATGLRSKLKVFASDPGLVMAFATLPVQDPTVRARVFEASVFRHLREMARGMHARLGYFRHQEELEIDFVLEDPKGPIFAAEVTSNPRLRADKLERLRRAGKALGTDKLTLVYGGLTESKIEGVRIVPLQTLLLDSRRLLE